MSYFYFSSFHVDGSYVRNANERSIYSIIIYLNEDFKGGETVFKVGEKEFSIKPVKIFFFNFFLMNFFFFKKIENRLIFFFHFDK